MSISNLPTFYSMRWCDKEGNLTVESNLYNDELSQTLISAIRLLNKIGLSNIITSGDNRGGVNYNGLQFPQKTTAEITAYASDTSVPNGTAWFDTDVSKLKVKTAAGTIETITSS